MNSLRKRSDKFLATEIDDETILLDLDGGELFALDGPARAIWHALDTAGGQAEIVALLAQRYDAPADLIAEDVGQFLAELRGAGLLA